MNKIGISGLENWAWRLSALLLVILISSLFVGFNFGSGWNGVSMAQGEIQIAYQIEVQRYSYSAQPPQGWSFFTVTPKLHWQPEINEAFGIGYLRLPLWIPLILSLAAAFISRLRNKAS